MKPLVILVTVLLYAVLIATVVWALVSARRAAIASYDTAAEQAHWEEFSSRMDQRHLDREEERKMIADAGGQPIEPKPPKARSPRPPALELLQNHFAAVLAVTLAGVSALFAVVWGFALGAWLRPGRNVEGVDDERTK